MKRDFAVAVKAVIIKENKALVLCRSKHEMECSYMNSHQKWDLPGGGLHFFEKAEGGTAQRNPRGNGLTCFHRTAVVLI